MFVLIGEILLYLPVTANQTLSCSFNYFLCLNIFCRKVCAMNNPGPTLDSAKSPVSPIKLWRSKLPNKLKSREKRSSSPKKKKPSAANPPRQTTMAGPTLRHTLIKSKSVKDSDFARSTIGDHELKLLRALESTDGADYVTTYKEFRKKLLSKNEPMKIVKISRPKKNLARFKMVANLIKGKELTFLSKAQLAFSPLNPHNDKNRTALMMKIRQMKLETGLEDPEQVDAVELEDSGHIPYDDTLDSTKEKEVEKKFKYIVGEYANSPFKSQLNEGFSPEHKKQGKLSKSESLQELVKNGHIQNSRALRMNKSESEGKISGPERNILSNKTRKNKKKKCRSHPYQANEYSKHLKEKEMQAKLPEKLRQTVEKSYDQLMKPFVVKKASEMTWVKLKAKKADQKEKESLTIMGSLTQSFSPPQSLMELCSSEDRLESPTEGFTLSKSHREHSHDNIISGDAMLYSLERDGLFTVDDLENLSVDSGKSQDLVEDGSEAGLFRTLDLMDLDIDDDDPLLTLDEDLKSPEAVLATSMGTLLFSPQVQEEVSLRPPSAGIGGVSNSKVSPSNVKSPKKQDAYAYHKKYSSSVISRRPKSANTSPHVRGCGDFEIVSEIPNHVHKKRLVINRHQSTNGWVS